MNSSRNSRLELLIRYSDSVRGRGNSLEPNATSDSLVVFEFPNNPRLGKRRVMSSELGIYGRFTAERGADAAFQIPEEIGWFLRQAVEDRPFDEPLWLEIQRERGWLTAFPWEQLLPESMQTLCNTRGECNRPILRKLPAEIVLEATLDSIDVLICATSPQATMEFDVAEKVRKLIDTLFAVQNGALNIHVFADAACFERITRDLPQTEQRKVNVHSPETAADYAAQPRSKTSSQETEVLNPWLRWMLDSLKGRPVDAVHFVCPAWMQSENACLSLAESPTQNNDRYWSRFVGVGQFTKFLICCGAWSANFSSLHRGYSSLAFRLLAADLANNWPNFITLLREDPYQSATNWESVYRFLFRKRPRPPAAKELLLYASPQCLQQPEITDGLESALPETLHLVLGKAEALRAGPSIAAAGATEQLPGWLVAGNRYLENFVASQQLPATESLPQASDLERQITQTRMASNDRKRESADYAMNYLLNLQQQLKRAE